MLRRFTTVACVLLMLLGVTRLGDRVDPQWGELIFYSYFGVLILLMLSAIVFTERGYFGPARHPVNRVFTGLSWVGMIGAVVLMLELVLGSGMLLWVNVIASACMFTGIVGAAVVALSARPWRDLFYSRRP
ncbi:hypothetical protein [Corynebacterium glyciniphilum]|uniref:hypothetical protein n=1 Tax=Corynebacterium glyciniphilum TaxID=1404244 RepID=UPI00264B0D43|nr:hypothetical protein [Corynebacterium glyciniphilum]MDN5683036.1 hypothetical protein [Corynebacterium glyciniphilum]